MVEYNYSDEERLITCTINYNGKDFVGSAKCHNDDNYKRSIGENIALCRAEIAYFQYVRDCELLPAYEALRQLYYSINRSKNYNASSYEARAIRRQMYQKKEDLDFVRGEIKYSREALQSIFSALNYIQGKKG